MTKYPIESGVPIPKTRDTTMKKYPIDKLDAGESILFPKSDRPKVQVMVTGYKKRTNKEFTVRLVSNDECRVWRIK